ncbi:hypothetical protein O9G_003243 [Rozella allomycis CSF55]|uniref:Uncharacterized protein n=1 Tax=Rozella allomycis (strain CSF55) TaxID=988480 RepID=A0A075AXD1_ROZAC|nr:hypothetical protein O9G_003243 [Rozella allomycis CSF55]|eukprot:EPZ33382.1 hypothetical protein O9G_003243 [Rozella allomycis CSF55]
MILSSNSKNDAAIETLIASKSAPSIPTKYRTLYIQQEEKKAFNCAAKRFYDKLIDTPAPGYYDKPNTLNVNITASEKGNSSFASKSKRFETPSDWYWKRQLGPNSYFPKLPKDMSVIVVSEPIIEDEKMTDAEIRELTSLKPAAAPHTRKHKIKSTNEAKTVKLKRLGFQTSAPRCLEETVMHVAPGEYSLDDYYKMDKYTPSFKYQSERRSLIESCNPAPNTYTLPSIFNNKTVKTEIKKHKSKEDVIFHPSQQSPGPGEYNPGKPYKKSQSLGIMFSETPRSTFKITDKENQLGFKSGLPLDDALHKRSFHHNLLLNL